MATSTENPYTIELNPAEAVLMHDVIEGTITSVDRDHKTVDVVLDEPYYPRNYETDYGKLEKHKKYEHLGIEPITEISGAKIIYNCENEHGDPSNAFHENDKVLIVAVNEEYFCVGFPDEIRECAVYDVLEVKIGWDATRHVINKALFLVAPNGNLELLHNELESSSGVHAGSMQFKATIDNDYLDVYIRVVYDGYANIKVIDCGNDVPATINGKLDDWLMTDDGCFIYRDSSGVHKYCHGWEHFDTIASNSVGNYIGADNKTYEFYPNDPDFGEKVREYTGEDITNEWIPPEPECSEHGTRDSCDRPGAEYIEDPYELSCEYSSYELAHEDDYDMSITECPVSSYYYCYNYAPDNYHYTRELTHQCSATLNGCTDCHDIYGGMPLSTDYDGYSKFYLNNTYDFSGPCIDAWILTRTLNQTFVKDHPYYNFNPAHPPGLRDSTFSGAPREIVEMDSQPECNLRLFLYPPASPYVKDYKAQDYLPQYPLKAGVRSKWDCTYEAQYHRPPCQPPCDGSNCPPDIYYTTKSISITRQIYLEGHPIFEITDNKEEHIGDPDTYHGFKDEDFDLLGSFMVSLAEVKHKIAAFYSEQTGYKFAFSKEGSTSFVDVTSTILNSIASVDHAPMDNPPGILTVRWLRSLKYAE